MRVLVSDHFKTEEELLAYANAALKDPLIKIISIIRDVTNGDWILFWQTI